MKIRPAERISKIKPYFFADLETRIENLKEEGLDIIRLDMGSPDLPPADHVIDALTIAARRPDVHGYGPSGGTTTLKRAMADYYRRRFHVDLNPSSEVLGLIGSKEGVFNLSQIFMNPSDLVLIPDPCYPVYAMGAMIAQAQVTYMPLLAENGFLPDLDAIPEETARRAKLMWLNYPNNPTGAVASRDFFEKAVSFAKKFEIVIAHDAPYVDVCFGDYQAPSLLEVPGAKDVVIEFNSLSKTYNMAGWRLGMAVGNPDLVKYLRVYKSQIDSSHFRPMMLAAESALLGDQTWIKDRNLIYQKRRDLIVNTLTTLGFKLSVPKAALYVWAHLPTYWQDGFDFCETLLRQTGVSITPGGVYGPSGAGYVRLSLVTPEARLVVAMQRIKEWIRERV